MIKSGAINKQLTYGQIKAMNAAKKRKKKKPKAIQSTRLKRRKYQPRLCMNIPC